MDTLRTHLEASGLQADLRHAAIGPWGWVINASLAATKTIHPLLGRARLPNGSRSKPSRAVSPDVSPSSVVAEEPVGAERLAALVTGVPVGRTRGYVSQTVGPLVHARCGQNYHRREGLGCRRSNAF